MNKYSGLTSLKVVAILLILFTVSCREGDTNLAKKQNFVSFGKTASYDGIPMFINTNILKTTIDNLAKTDYNGRKLFEKNLMFTSLKSELENINSGEITSTKFYDQNIANVINKDGLVVIGWKLYKFDNNYTRTIEIKDFSKLASYADQLKQSKSNKSDNVIQVLDVEYSPISLKTNIPGARVPAGGYTVESERTNPAGGNFRFSVAGTLAVVTREWQEQSCDGTWDYDPIWMTPYCNGTAGPIERGRETWVNLFVEGLRDGNSQNGYYNYTTNVYANGQVLLYFGQNSNGTSVNPIVLNVNESASGNSFGKVLYYSGLNGPFAPPTADINITFQASHNPLGNYSFSSSVNLNR